MPNYAEGINPEVLQWARERAGYSIPEIANAFRKDSAEILMWEDGSAVPTYNQLEKLAYRFYKRPIALFFFPSPPPEVDPKEEFRTLPDFEIEKLIPDTRHAIREGQARQRSLRELLSGKNPADQKIFDDIHIEPSDPVERSAYQVRSYFGIAIDEQSSWSGNTDALRNWRSIVEEAGIFVFKRSFRQVEISGFSLIDNEFPIIYLNNSTAKSRQIFTLFHELAHILLRTSGIALEDDSFISALKGINRSVEVFCNAFSGEFLAPSDDLFQRFIPGQSIDEAIDRFSSFYHVSREVVLRKFLDRGLVNQDYYEKMANIWEEEFSESRKSRTGGNYYATQAAYLGDKYLKLAFSRYYEGRLSLAELSGYLNVKAKSVEGLEQQMIRRAAIE